MNLKRLLSLTLFILVLITTSSILAQTASSEPNTGKPGVKQVQVPFASLKPIITFKIASAADWVLVTENAVWVAGEKPNSVQRIDPNTNRIVAKVSLTGEACSGLAYGFGSVWVPTRGNKAALVRVDARSNRIIATFPIPPAAPEGGITTSTDTFCSAHLHG